MRLTEFRLSTELIPWRNEVRGFLAAEMAPERVAGHVDPTDLTGLDLEFEQRHQREAARRGFLAVSLPKAVGGGGRSRAWKHVYDLEAAYHGAPSIDTGVTLCGFVLSQFGTSAQKSRWLAPMISGEMLGAIAYSEAGAGNNLAAISTTGARDSEGWVLSGTKSHVTGAHKAEVAVVLAVTDSEAKPRSSMTMFLVPLDAPGVEVKRKPTINRWTLSEINLNHVRPDDDCVLGEVGAGWSQVLAAVAAERGSLAHYGWAEQWLQRLPAGVPRLERARLHAAATRVRAFGQRLNEYEESGRPVGYEASVMKVASTELLQDIARTARSGAEQGETNWTPMFEDGPSYAYDALEAIHPTVSVGANETHRDMIATELLNRDLSVAASPTAAFDDPVLSACADQAAQARQILALTAQHALQRPLFGKQVGDFQTARHRFVDMAIAVEALELTAVEAALAPSGPQRDYLVSAAKVTGNESLLDVVAGAHQLHGADGYYDNHYLAPFTRRAWAVQSHGGTTAEHLENLARLTA
ncbi:MAG: acyl-CoA dehydrogenase family protein [bacterium]|nr:acyl-CoA dehydrogenase family protein [bacterium]